MQRIRKRTIAKVQAMARNKGPKLYSPRNKIHNCIWIFKVGDRDDQPSVPHAHSKEEGYRLNAWTGEIYPPGTERKNPIGHLTKKELAALYKDSGFIDFAIKQIDWYQREFPHISFFIPDWFRLKYMMGKVELRGLLERKREKDTYIFISGKRR